MEHCLITLEGLELKFCLKGRTIEKTKRIRLQQFAEDIIWTDSELMLAVQNR